jgi:hypothetical protein
VHKWGSVRSPILPSGQLSPCESRENVRYPYAMRRTLFLCVLIVSMTANARASDENDTWQVYPLDGVSRALPAASRRVRCDRSALVRYRGTSLRFNAASEIHRDFVPYVARLEAIARDVAIAHFGRAPRVLVHHGAFNCRTIRGTREVLSEHAFGNAIDVRGFDFGPLRRNEAVPDGVSPRLGRAFRVRVEQHWHADERHPEEAAFLTSLCARLLRERDLFRVMLGPAFPGHKNHFHFDRAPFTYVAL